jgi:cytochrome P450
MGWPQELQQPLGQWASQNQQATLQQDRTALARLAAEFENIVTEQLTVRRQPGVAADADITTELMHEQIAGRSLSDMEIASILRNWTVGEVGTLASAIGIIAHFLAGEPALQQLLREQPDKLYYANDEIQRMHNPLLENRRRAVGPVEIGGRQIAAGERVYLNWVAVNRDPEVFPEPERFSWERNPQDNLLYGAGVHVCPGAPMARMELVEVIDSLLQHSRNLELATGQEQVLAQYPATGYAQLWLSGF